MTRFILSLVVLFLVLAWPAQARNAQNAHKSSGSAPTKGAAQLQPTTKRNPTPVVVASTKKPSALSTPILRAAAAAKSLARSSEEALSGRLARLTAYWSGEGDYYTRRCMSSTGIRLHDGHCAVDPTVIPYGSVVQIAGLGNYLAVDTGTAVVSRRAAREAGHNRGERNALVIDLFFESSRDGEAFAANGPKYASISWSKSDDVAPAGMTGSTLKGEAAAAAAKLVASSQPPVISSPKPIRSSVALAKPLSLRSIKVASAKHVNKHDTQDILISSAKSRSPTGTKVTLVKATLPLPTKVAVKAVVKKDETPRVLLAQADVPSHRKTLYQF